MAQASERRKVKEEKPRAQQSGVRGISFQSSVEKSTIGYQVEFIYSAASGVLCLVHNSGLSLVKPPGLRAPFLYPLL